MSAYGSSRVQGRDEAESANQNSQAAFFMKTAKEAGNNGVAEQVNEKAACGNVSRNHFLQCDSGHPCSPASSEGFLSGGSGHYGTGGGSLRSHLYAGSYGGYDRAGAGQRK